ncbi:PDZ domain-containing protein 6 [Phytophthora infestans]|uniref:PDZ domain-containing protein 6 n=1 Tax=Phytophthora infestans TaxID=4787 RepID=A0A833WSR2_PHYIN|nr:PDZ domain-containing protein 6 [Phytophthora infestans]
MNTLQFDVVIKKTDEGFGIYFTKVARIENDVDLLVVDGLVEDPASSLRNGLNKEALDCLQLGDILTKVNGEDCEGKKVADIIGLLRGANSGENTLSFSRNVPSDANLKGGVNTKTDNEEAGSAIESSRGGFMDAIRKVKSKIRSEIDGDEEGLFREQFEDEQFEKQWLEEFDALKKQFERKWETCTYTADEFCGLLYRSSDAQQKEYLQQEYPTLMDAWKDGCASTSSSRVIPEWPAVKNTYSCAVNYDPIDSSKLVFSSNGCSGTSVGLIHSSGLLQSTLECLRVDFMWRSDNLRAFSRRLEAAGISSCSGLLEELNVRRLSSHFERNFQSVEYPRLTKTVLRTLRENAQSAVTAPLW